MDFTTKVESLNAAHDEMYSIQHCVIKFVSDLIQHYVIKFISDLIQHYVIEFVSDLIQHYVIKFVSDLIQHYVIKFVRSVIFSWYSGFLHQFIVKSDVKHQNPRLQNIFRFLWMSTMFVLLITVNVINSIFGTL